MKMQYGAFQHEVILMQIFASMSTALPVNSCPGHITADYWNKLCDNVVFLIVNLTLYAPCST